MAPLATPDIFRALADPMRWAIVREMARVPELTCSGLAKSLPIARTTVTFHVRALVNAGLVESRKQGRQYFYSLRHDVLTEAVNNAAQTISTVPSVGCDGR